MSHMILFLLASLIAVIYAIGQRNIYKMLSFIFISQISLALFAFSLEALLGYVYALSILFPLLALLIISYVVAITSSAEIEKTGGLLSVLPISAWTFIIASLILSLFPPFMPFVLEHFIVEKSLLLGQMTPVAIIILVLIRVLTIVCLFKTAHKVFFGTPCKLEVKEPKIASLAIIFVSLSVIITFSPYIWNLVISLGVYE